MTEKNTRILEQVRVTPKEAQKAIAAGRLKGFTDINPMWRIIKLTELYGPCGTGWYYTIDKQWTEPGNGGDSAAFCNISLYVKENNEWSKPIQGNGGSMFVALEKNGPHTSDEAFKMALTDAISIACKSLGFSADIYYSKDRTKYDQPNTTTTPHEDVAQGSVEGLVSPDKIPEKPKTQSKPKTNAKSNMSEEQLYPMCFFTTNFESASMKPDQVDEVLGYDLEHMKKALDHWKSNYPKLKVSYANQDKIKAAIKALEDAGPQGEYEEPDIEPPIVDEPPLNSYDEEIDDLPF